MNLNTLRKEEKEVSLLLKKLKAGDTSPALFFDLVKKSEIYSNHVQIYRERNNSPDPVSEEYLSFLFSELQMLRKVKDGKEKISDKARKVWQDNIHIFAISTFFFATFTIVGLFIGYEKAELVSLFLDNSFREKIINHDAWYERLNMAPLFGAVTIMINNMKVSLFAWCLGITFGLGSLYILSLNGLSIGVILGYCLKHNFEGLNEFVLSHGPLELFNIIVGATAGLIIGKSFYHKPFKGLKARLAKNSMDSFYLVLVTLPWLFIAGIVEAFISPLPVIPLYLKLGLGILLATVFFLWLNNWNLSRNLSRGSG